ncbi:DNA polymerase subunit gamma-2, mitochondrial isoform X1 [Homalodisca vitripennis]|uniref:DNA polymerase subunit gamma-2, mitochondrial isoform X1 n=1 Tax=Homalodisca vitripennis TaxID=197043 RepID=UPI001EEB9E13|nr:DNA polymerase subunit gamma-2, mitochondrial isoform X1 [Homalodisca vitripennis]
MSEHLRKILELSTKLGFFKMVESNNVKTISFGPLAILLANNIHNEWFRSNVINSELNTFLYESNPDHTWQEDSQLAYNQLLQANSEQLPFGLASAFQTCMPTKANEDKDSQLQGMTHCQTKGYRHLVFISEKDSQKYFYRLQLKRRIWWRKFSTDPERFQISEYKTGEHGEYVQISAKFPFTTEVVETIHNHSSSLLNGYGSLFEVKVGRKKMMPHVIESVCLERPAVLTYLCDAFQTQPARAVLRLHHSLAPYKVALAVDPREDRLEELGQLATFLCLNLRKEGVHTLFISSSRSKKTKEAQLGFHDSIGIPYTVVVNAESLINGIVGLRSRDTTLQEQVHVSKLTSYMQRLLS